MCAYLSYPQFSFFFPTFIHNPPLGFHFNPPQPNIQYIYTTQRMAQKISIYMLIFCAIL